jgi:thiaminase/transcriptional activator TenA
MASSSSPQQQQQPRRFTDELRDAAGEQWTRVIHHKFTKEVAAGTIDRQHVMKRYLIQDHRFLDAFVVLLASVIAHARTLEDRIPGCQFLALITGKENTYFERCFAKLNCSPKERATIPDAACTIGFCNLMRTVAYDGSLAEMLSVLVVCEWSYLSWGQMVEKDTVRDDFITYEWVDLHTGESFEAVVEYIRGLLDKEGTLIDTNEREKCKQRFLEAVQLEEDFFEYAYNG